RRSATRVLRKVNTSYNETPTRKEFQMDDFEERVMHELQKFKSKRYCARFATKWIVRSSVCGVVAVLIKDRVEPDTRKEKIELYVASWALSGMLAEQAADYAGERFDS